MKLSRRQFLARTGWVAGGLTVVTVAGCQVIPPLPTFSEGDDDDALTWIQMLPNGRVRFLLPRSELGQGVAATFSQVVADELRVPVSNVDCLHQSTAAMAPCKMTVGSESVQVYFKLVATAAANLRESIRDFAAQSLSVDRKTLTIEKGGFANESDSLISYESILSVVGDEIRAVQLSDDVELISIRDRRLQGQEIKEAAPIHVERIVTGRETYSRDVRLEGMLFGAIARPPMLGARIARFDASRASEVAGYVATVEHGKQVGVVAETPMAARMALALLNVDWEPLDRDEIAAADRVLDIDSHIERPGMDHTVEKNGNVGAGKDLTKKHVSLRFDSPMVAHAAMEPRTGIAEYTSDKGGREVCNVWTGCQDPWFVQSTIAKAIGLRKSRVNVQNHRCGGAFGGRVLCQAAVEAAWLSKAVRRPVKVQWTREEEFLYNYVGPQYSTRIDAGLDEAGRISYWHHRAVGMPILTSSMFLPPYLYWVADRVPDPGTKRGLVTPYQVENRLLQFSDERLPMPTGPWRGLGAAPNTFAVECAMDELSVAAASDPISFRLAHLPPGRLATCLERLRELLGDKADDFGIAVAAYKEVTFVALAARVVEANGRPKVTEMICVHDCGYVVSPNHVKAQIEGNLVWGIGMALSESYAVEGAIGVQRNFDTYQIPRIDEMPVFTIELVHSNLPSSGAAEAAIAPAAAAIANAVSRMSSQRPRTLPIGRVPTPQRNSSN